LAAGEFEFPARRPDYRPTTRCIAARIFLSKRTKIDAFEEPLTLPSSTGEIAMWSGKEDDRGRFKTPPLSEVDRTSPYMHDGSKASLEEVVNFYDDGARPKPNLRYRDPSAWPDRRREEGAGQLLTVAVGTSAGGTQ